MFTDLSHNAIGAGMGGSAGLELLGRLPSSADPVGLSGEPLFGLVVRDQCSQKGQGADLSGRVRDLFRRNQRAIAQCPAVPHGVHKAQVASALKFNPTDRGKRRIFAALPASRGRDVHSTKAGDGIGVDTEQSRVLVPRVKCSHRIPRFVFSLSIAGNYAVSYAYNVYNIKRLGRFFRKLFNHLLAPRRIRLCRALCTAT